MLLKTTPASIVFGTNPRASNWQARSGILKADKRLASHFLAGRKSFMVIPTDVIDDELDRMIDDRTAVAHDS